MEVGGWGGTLKVAGHGHTPREGKGVDRITCVPERPSMVLLTNL